MAGWMIILTAAVQGCSCRHSRYMMHVRVLWKRYRRIRKSGCIYVTPQGIPFTQAKARELAAQDELLLLCGHYEGIDERVLEEVVTDYISIGDYVLTGGELAAMVIVDAVARLFRECLEMNSRP